MNRKKKAFCRQAVILLVVSHAVVLWTGYLLGASKTSTTKSNNVTETTSSLSTNTYTCSHPELTVDALKVDINEYRLQKGLNILDSDRTLEQYSKLRAEEIQETGTVTHTTKYKNFSTWLSENHLSTTLYQGYTEQAEILEKNPGGTSCDIVRGWEDSLTHNQILIYPNGSLMGMAIVGDIAVGTFLRK